MKNICSFFIIIFSLFLVTPTVVTLIKNSIDISYVYTVNEEEQNNTEERTFSEKHTKFINKYLTLSLGLMEFPESNFSTVFHNNWSPVYFDLNSPPPEYI